MCRGIWIAGIFVLCYFGSNAHWMFSRSSEKGYLAGDDSTLRIGGAEPVSRALLYDPVLAPWEQDLEDEMQNNPQYAGPPYDWPRQGYDWAPSAPSSSPTATTPPTSNVAAGTDTPQFFFGSDPLNDQDQDVNKTDPLGGGSPQDSKASPLPASDGEGHLSPPPDPPTHAPTKWQGCKTTRWSQIGPVPVFVRENAIKIMTVYTIPYNDHNKPHDISDNSTWNGYLKKKYGPAQYTFYNVWDDGLSASLAQYRPDGLETKNPKKSSGRYEHVVAPIPRLAIGVREYIKFNHIQDNIDQWNPVNIHPDVRVQCAPLPGPSIAPKDKIWWRAKEKIRLSKFERLLPGKVAPAKNTALYNYLEPILEFSPPGGWDPLLDPGICKASWPNGRKPRLLLMGDSHMATIFEGMKELFTGELSPHLKLDSRAEEWDLFHARFEHVEFPEPDDLLPQILKHAPDVVVFNSGQWPAARFHWTFEKYRNGTEATIKMLQDTKIPFLVMESLAMTPRPDWVVRDKKDWRTNARLYEYNEIVKKAMRSSGIEDDLIEMFDLTLPIVGTSHDQCHFQGWAREAVVKNAFHHICRKLSQHEALLPKLKPPPPPQQPATPDLAAEAPPSPILVEGPTEPDASAGEAPPSPILGEGPTEPDATAAEAPPSPILGEGPTELPSPLPATTPSSGSTGETPPSPNLGEGPTELPSPPAAQDTAPRDGGEAEAEEGPNDTAGPLVAPVPPADTATTGGDTAS